MDLSILRKLKLVMQKNDLTTEEGRGHEREKRLILSALWAVIAKCINTAIPLITIKITISYLGTELYGLWATITSFFALFAFADLGLGNGLQTELSRSVGKEDTEEGRTLISSAYLVLLLVPAIIIFVFCCIYPFVDWGSIMGAESEEAVALAGGFVLALFLSKLIGVPVSLVQRIHNALQEGYIASIWVTVGSIFSLITIVLVWFFDLGKMEMMWASSFIVVFVYILNTIHFFKGSGKKYLPSFKALDKAVAIRLLSTGGLFLILSILTTVSLSLDTFIVTKVVGISETASYAVAYRIALFIGVISNMLSTPLWAATGEALERGDYRWVHSRTMLMTKYSFWGSIVASIILIVLANPVLSWMGKDLYVSIPVLIGMCLTQVLVATTNPAFMVLNASRRIIIQIVMYGLYSIISLILKFYLGKLFGTLGVSMCGAISYFVIIVPFLYFAYKKVLSQEKSKI